MNDVIRDLIIIGGGPAGLTAAIYASRERFDTLLLEKAQCGGLTAVTNLVENYPGFPDGINGMELIEKFKEQARRFGADILEFEEVKAVHPDKNKIRVQTAKAEHSASAVIIASGSIPKKLNIPGEEKYTGRGVSYCAICDGPLYKDKDVLVVGGGNAAAEEALFLTKFCRGVILVHRRDELRAAKIFQERLRADKKIKLMLNHVPVSINGREVINSITVKDAQTHQEQILKVCGVFIYIGFSPNSRFLEGVVELDSSGCIKTDERMQTSAPGIYAAGDVRSGNIRQITAACGEAAVCAISVRNYLKKLT